LWRILNQLLHIESGGANYGDGSRDMPYSDADVFLGSV
jgi:hypothetical protein